MGVKGKQEGWVLVVLLTKEMCSLASISLLFSSDIAFQRNSSHTGAWQESLRGLRSVQLLIPRSRHKAWPASGTRRLLIMEQPCLLVLELPEGHFHSRNKYKEKSYSVLQPSFKVKMFLKE